MCQDLLGKSALLLVDFKSIFVDLSTFFYVNSNKFSLENQVSLTGLLLDYVTALKPAKLSLAS